MVSRVLFLGQEFVLFPFPLQSRPAQEGWLVGWLHRTGNQETASPEQQMEDSMCLHCRNSHKCSFLHIFFGVYVFKILDDPVGGSL